MKVRHIVVYILSKRVEEFERTKKTQLMCHPGVPFVHTTTWLLFQVEQVGRHAPRQVHHGDEHGDGGGGSSNMKRCVCSPSQHPGSFRCRHHHGEYVWRGRTMK